MNSSENVGSNKYIIEYIFNRTFYFVKKALFLKRAFKVKIPNSCLVFFYHF